MIFILFFTLILNVVAIALIYYCLPDIEKKEKIIFIVTGIAVMYMLTTFIYWLSTKGIKLEEVSEKGKSIITFAFVPINGMIVLPILAKSYNKYKIGRLASDKLRNRVIALALLLLIVSIMECSYFKQIQNGVINLIEKNNKTNEITTNIINETNIIESQDINTISNEVIVNEIDEISNNIMQENYIVSSNVID